MPLQEQPARILGLLVSRPGEVVTREELRQLVWTDDTFVEFDASLNAALTKIRRALGIPQALPASSRPFRSVATAFSPTCRGSSLGGVNGRRHASRRRCSFSALGYRSSTASPDGRSSTQDSVAGSRRRDASLGLGLVPRTARHPPRRSCGRYGAALRNECRASRGDAPNLGSELAAAIGGRLGRLHTLTVKPWPPGATADPRALSRELGVDDD